MRFPIDPESSPPFARSWSRRRVLRAGLATAGALAVSPLLVWKPARAASAPDSANRPLRVPVSRASGEPQERGYSDPVLPPRTRSLLESSPFVYISPLRRSGRESTCHGEVWYGWLDGTVVIITSTGSWKARALERGLDRARLWVGDHGRWKGWLWNNEAFREAPSFDARAKIDADADLLERLMQGYREKYPEEIRSWEPRMRAGFERGDRVLIRYVPIEYDEA